MVRLFLALVLGVALSLGGYPSSAQAIGWPSLPAALTPPLPSVAAAVPTGEVKAFAKAYQSIQAIRDEAETKMAEAVEGAGFTVEAFNDLADKALADNEPPADAATAATFDGVIERITILRQEAEETMVKAIEKAGISVDRFNEILDLSDQDPDLYQRIGDQINGR
ncbi:hypothetical protein GFS31_23160 [Leptolyngbya sp. BL0902]|uniref:DUF4168 domain-containing protein n=1 Tax=Leptolyngbya sp. BL0902 TaxID=1115757 RepID=UPI0018E904E1|nr:DUF4168 domain-containing protein [Leptolyngbya sp. BL0902]QQE65628.1 hypothetical protein GFS31_23160 [Leptolyngbya sp. BL0902]